MGWFDTAATWVVDTATDYFSKPENVMNLAGNVINTGLDLYSSNQAQQANKKAAQTVASGYEAQAAAIRDGNQKAQDQFELIQSQSKPGIQYLQKVTDADPYNLTQGQQQQLDRVRASSVNGLNKSGLRGSGRAVTESLRNIESDYTGRAIDSNLSRTQQAASQLAGYNQSAAMSSAGADLSTGNNIGQTKIGSAEAVAQGALSNTALKGDAIGGIQSVIASEQKEGRKSQYGWT